MSDPERITGLINDIYDAALDESLWPRVLRRAMELLDGVSAAAGPDAAPPAGHFHSEVDDPVHADFPISRHARWNPLVPPEEEATPRAAIEKSPQRILSLMVLRHAVPGPAQERARNIMRRLAPHFTRAAAIARALQASGEKTAALEEVLERLSAAVVLVDRAGRLMHTNAAAARMLAENEVLGWSGGKPQPRQERAAAHLAAVLAAAHGRRPAPECCALSVPHCTGSGEQLTVHVLPLRAAARRQATAPRAAAAAIIVSPHAGDLAQRLRSAATLYALTPAESRVVSVLLAGCTVGATARTLGVTEATVKTHLQHVFDKTGTRRQVDLARRIAEAALTQTGKSEIS